MANEYQAESINEMKPILSIFFLSLFNFPFIFRSVYCRWKKNITSLFPWPRLKLPRLALHPTQIHLPFAQTIIWEAIILSQSHFKALEDLTTVQFQFWGTAGINGLLLNENAPFLESGQPLVQCSISWFYKYAPYPYFRASHCEEHSRLSPCHPSKPQVLVQNS